MRAAGRDSAGARRRVRLQALDPEVDYAAVDEVGRPERAVEAQHVASPKLLVRDDLDDPQRGYIDAVEENVRRPDPDGVGVDPDPSLAGWWRVQRDRLDGVIIQIDSGDPGGRCRPGGIGPDGDHVRTLDSDPGGHRRRGRIDAEHEVRARTGGPDRLVTHGEVVTHRIQSDRVANRVGRDIDTDEPLAVLAVEDPDAPVCADKAALDVDLMGLDDVDDLVRRGVDPDDVGARASPDRGPVVADALTEPGVRDVGVDRREKLVARRIDPDDVAVVALYPHGPEPRDQPVGVPGHLDDLDRAFRQRDGRWRCWRRSAARRERGGEKECRESRDQGISHDSHLAPAVPDEQAGCPARLPVLARVSGDGSRAHRNRASDCSPGGPSRGPILRLAPPASSPTAARLPMR